MLEVELGKVVDDFFRAVRDHLGLSGHDGGVLAAFSTVRRGVHLLSLTRDT